MRTRACPLCYLGLSGKKYSNYSKLLEFCCKLIREIKFVRALQLQLLQLFYNEQLLYGAYKLIIF